MRTVEGPTFVFYVPSAGLVNAVPPSIDEYWPWINAAVRTTPAQLADGRGDCTWVGPYNWTIQTYLYLQAAGVNCRLSSTLPDAGVILTHSDFLSANMCASRTQFLVEIKPDRPLACTFANFVVTQNRRDPIASGFRRFLIPSAPVPYWPQPGLRPRDPARGDRFENVSYMGNPEQFLADRDALAAEVAQLGLQWRMMPRERWSDYSDTDVVVAVRPTPSEREQASSPLFTPETKPASKLCNAWLAGVPAVLSPDVAFRELRRSDLDYLEAISVADVVAQLRRLRDDPALRRSMADNARLRATGLSTSRAATEWRRVLETLIAPRYDRWRRSALRRRCVRQFRPAVRRFL